MFSEWYPSLVIGRHCQWELIPVSWNDELLCK